MVDGHRGLLGSGVNGAQVVDVDHILTCIRIHGDGHTGGCASLGVSIAVVGGNCSCGKGITLSCACVGRNRAILHSLTGVQILGVIGVDNCHIGLFRNFNNTTGFVLQRLDSNGDDRIVIHIVDRIIDTVDAGLFDLDVIDRIALGNGDILTQIHLSIKVIVAALGINIPVEHMSIRIGICYIVGAQVIHIPVVAPSGFNQASLNIDFVPFVAAATARKPGSRSCRHYKVCANNSQHQYQC